MGVSLFVAIVYIADQLDRRPALRRHRSADPSGMSESTPTGAPCATRCELRGRRCRPDALRAAWRQPLAIVGIAIAVDLARDRDLRAAARAARPARAGLRAAAAPVAAPVRHRRARPRRAEPRHVRRAPVAAARAAARPLVARDRRSCSAPSPATSAASSTASIMRLTDLVFAFPAIILAMVVTAALGPSLHERRARAGDRLAGPRTRASSAGSCCARATPTTSRRRACSARRRAARSSA